MALKVDVEELRERLAIDKHSLDEEIEQQAEVYYVVAEAAVLAKSRMDAAEEDVKLIQAKLDPLIRAKLEKNEEKVTEAVVRSAIIQHPQSKEAVETARNIREEYEKLSALKDAFRQRSSMLRDLVELHVSGYYTDRSVRGSANKASDHKADQVRQRLSEMRKVEKSEERSKSRRRGDD